MPFVPFRFESRHIFNTTLPNGLLSIWYRSASAASSRAKVWATIGLIAMIPASYRSLSRLSSTSRAAAQKARTSRVSSTPLVDKGFASVHRIGNGLYATISDPSKGLTTGVVEEGGGTDFPAGSRVMFFGAYGAFEDGT